MTISTQLKASSEHYLIAILMVLLGLLPVSIITSAVAPSYVYYGALVISVVLLVRRKQRESILEFVQGNRLLVVSLGLMPLVVLFATLWNGFLSGRDLELSLRLFLGCLVILFALQEVSSQQLVKVLWGYVFAGLIGAAFVFYLAWPEFGRPDTKALYNAVIYGNLIFSILVCIIFSLEINTNDGRYWGRLTKILVGLFVFASFVLTQTRTAWLAVPACAVIAGILWTKRPSVRKIAGFSLVLLLVFSAVFVANDPLRERAILGYQEVINCHGEGRTTNNSLCIRLQLWRASYAMAQDRPIAGIGSSKLFTDYLQTESLPRGIVTESVSKWWEPHSDLFLALAAFGWPGAIAMLLVYFGPAWLFARRLSFKNDIAVRAAAAIGLAFCITFFVSGFGDTMFRSMRIASFYAVTLAVFMRLSQP